jgi:hypothetical protein
MAEKCKLIFKNDYLMLSECKDGFWLYDYFLGYNISIRANTEREAFVEAIEKYQKSRIILTEELKDIRCKVDKFIDQFVDYENNND